MSELLIVGAGPTGLTLALGCLRQGVSFRLIDRLPEPSGLSKALAIWSGALETLDALGLAGKFLACGLQSEGIRIQRGRSVLVEMPAGISVDTPFPQKLVLPQAVTESLLTAELTKHNIRIERGTELEGLQEARDGVRAIFKKPDGSSAPESFRWVAGCDGAHSAVRNAAAIPFDGDSLPEEYLLCDTRIEGDLAEAWAHLFWADGLLAIFPVLRGVWRVIATRDPDNNGGDPTLDDIQKLVDRRGPGGLRLHDATWISKFHVSERKASTFAKGRVFLCGDAAHIHSPAGGQGMNLGIQDAFNLSWKLGLAARGIVTTEQVATAYTAERMPVAEGVLRESGRMIRSNFTGNPVFQFLRDTTARIANHSTGAKRAMARALSGTTVRYGEGPFVGSDTSWEEDWRPYGFAPGTRVRDEILWRDNEPVSLWKELLSPEFTLLLLSGRQPNFRDVDRLNAVRDAALGRDQLRIVQVWNGENPPPGEWLMDANAKVHRRCGAEVSSWYLVRPDGFVAKRSQPADAAVLRSWLDAVMKKPAG